MRWYLDEALRVIEGETLADEVTDAGDILAWARGGSKSVRSGTTHGGLTLPACAT